MLQIIQRDTDYIAYASTANYYDQIKIIKGYVK